MRFFGVLDTGRKILTANVRHGTSGNAHHEQMKASGPTGIQVRVDRGAGLSEKIKTF